MGRFLLLIGLMAYGLVERLGWAGALAWYMPWVGLVFGAVLSALVLRSLVSFVRDKISDW